MPQVNYSEGVQEVTPTTSAPDDYQRINASPESFGASIGQGLEKLGAGVSKANAFYSRAAADDASNQHTEFANKLMYGDPSKMVTQPDGTQVPDTGYMGLKGSAALSARAGIKQQLDDNIKTLGANLSNDESKLEFDNFTRRYRASLDERIGSHASSQANVWYEGVNQNVARVASTNIAIHSNDDNEFNHNVADMTGAYIQNAQLKYGVDLTPEQRSEAAANALRDGWKVRINSIGTSDPAKAFQLIEANRAVLGTDYDPLYRQFKAQKEQQTGLNAGAAAWSGAPMPYQVRDAIFNQESGNRSGIGVSVDNAHGPAQITPGTWARFARPGEKIDNPNDSRVVGDRIINYYYQKYNGDAARVAVAYFSGDGNVAPPGSATPWLRDAKDGNGKSVSGYVTDIMGRVAGGPAGGKADAYQRIKDNPDLSFSEKNHGYAYINQQEAGQQNEKTTVQHLVQDDTASILTTGQPSSALSVDRVRASLGPDAADQFAVNRGIAQTYYQRTADWGSLSDNQIYDSVQLLKPDPGQPGFAYAQKLQEHASEVADALLKKRYDDPAGSVEHMPNVQAAKSDADPQAIIKQRLLAQTQLGIPDGAPSPIPDDEAKRYAALLRPVSRGQADVQDQDQTISSVVDEVNKKYGDYAQRAMSRVLYHVTMKQDAADALSAAMQRYAKKEPPPLVTPDEARRVQIERDADTAAAIAGMQAQQEATASFDVGPVQSATVKPAVEQADKPQQKPFWMATDLLRSDPARLMPAFVKRFGEASVPLDLKQYIQAEPQGQK